MSDYPNVDEQKNFIRAYLNESSGGVGNFTDDDFQRVVEEVEPFVAVSHFFWGVWALLQVELSPVKFGFAVKLFSMSLLNKTCLHQIDVEEYGKERLSLYFKLKSSLTKLLNKNETTQNQAISFEAKVNGINNFDDSTNAVVNKNDAPASKLEAFVTS